jgi:hypothetical protein
MQNPFAYPEQHLCSERWRLNATSNSIIRFMSYRINHAVKQTQLHRESTRISGIKQFLKNKSVIPCCADNDSCLASGLCHYAQSEVGGSGFYAAGCTDNTFSSKSCPQLCSMSGLNSSASSLLLTYLQMTYQEEMSSTITSSIVGHVAEW